MRKLLQKLYSATKYVRLQRQLLTVCVKLLRILLTKAPVPVKVRYYCYKAVTAIWYERLQRQLTAFVQLLRVLPWPCTCQGVVLSLFQSLVVTVYTLSCQSCPSLLADVYEMPRYHLHVLSLT